MMFNLPLPGGTSGHAVGVSLATVILGPWASMITVSVALLIQALFFGDGGVTAFGANAFNMAIVGSLVAHCVYRLIAGNGRLASTRRVVAAALAGYAAINVAALCAAIEFGIQPLLFKDATGAPLYAFYPLSLAVPAMMIGHLTFAGLAEAIITGGVVAYLQRTDLSLLRLTAPGKLKDTLAAGTAWGEWGAEDFSKPEARREMSAASGNAAPPTQPPAGLARLANIWTAPMPDYAPPFMRSQVSGYLMSVMVGTGLIIVLFLMIGRLGQLGQRKIPAPSAEGPGEMSSVEGAREASQDGNRRKRRRSFIERTIIILGRRMERALAVSRRERELRPVDYPLREAKTLRR